MVGSAAPGPKQIAYVFEAALRRAFEERGCACVGVTDRYGCGALPDLICNCPPVVIVEAKYKSRDSCTAISARKARLLRRLSVNSPAAWVVFCAGSRCRAWRGDELPEPRPGRRHVGICMGRWEGEPLGAVVEKIIKTVRGEN